VQWNLILSEAKAPEPPLKRAKNMANLISENSPDFSTPMAQAINALIASSPVLVPVPPTATSAGTPGMVSFDSQYFYACVSANVWRRTAWELF
jgi:hypothetical protein